MDIKDRDGIKVRKVGNSNVFTIPKYIHPTDDNYQVFQGRHGDIIYTPKRKNIFKDKEFIKKHDWKQNEEWSDKLVGEEKID